LDKDNEMVGKRAVKSVPFTKTWAPAYPPYREMLYMPSFFEKAIVRQAKGGQHVAHPTTTL
jgi:hypothetical protein